MSVALLSRSAVLDVYTAQGVPGAREWLLTGDGSHLPRAWRVVLGRAALKIERAFSGEKPLPELPR